MQEFKVIIQDGEIKMVVTEGIHAIAISKGAEAYAKEEAYQRAISTIYTVAELTKRIKLSKPRIYELIDSGELRKVDAAKKGYRVTELAVRQWSGDVI